MVGYPASGKTTIAKTIFEPANYYRVDGDSLKTAKAMIKDAEKHVGAQSILFDSTAGTKDKRAQFIAFAQKYNLPVRVLWLQTSIEQSIENNKQRGSTVPLIAFYMYRKNFEVPTEDEGFTLITV
jgi:predicted kinase